MEKAPMKIYQYKGSAAADGEPQRKNVETKKYKKLNSVKVEIRPSLVLRPTISCLQNRQRFHRRYFQFYKHRKDYLIQQV